MVVRLPVSFAVVSMVGTRIVLVFFVRFWTGLDITLYHVHTRFTSLTSLKFPVFCEVFYPPAKNRYPTLTADEYHNFQQ